MKPEVEEAIVVSLWVLAPIHNLIVLRSRVLVLLVSVDEVIFVRFAQPCEVDSASFAERFFGEIRANVRSCAILISTIESSPS